MSIPRVCAAFLGLALALGAGPVGAQQSGAESDPVVARVDGQEIHRSEVIALAHSLPPQYQAQLAQIFPLLVERLVDFRLASKAGRAAGLAGDDEVKRRVATAEEQVIRDVYLEREIEKRMTDEALQERYKKFVEANPPQMEQRARHILLKTEEEAKAVIVELDAGADFEQLARERSTGPSAAQGGDLGYFSDGQMVPEFAEAAKALQPGEHSKTPTQTQFGWHVIRVEDRRQAPPPAFEEMQGQLRQELSREAVEGIFAELRGKANVEIVPAGEGASQQ